MKKGAALGLLLAAGCLRPDHSLLGRTCSDDAQCGADLRCVADVCALAAGDADAGSSDAGNPTNALSNGDFHDGLTGWSPLSDSTIALEPSVFRTAAPSVRVQPATPPGSYLGLALDQAVVTPVQAGTTYCGEAWIQRGSTRGAFVIVVRRYTSTGTWEDSARNPGSGQTPPDDGWVRVVDHVATLAGDSSVNLRLYTSDFVAGDAFFVDDVRVWVDLTGSCAP